MLSRLLRLWPAAAVLAAAAILNLYSSHEAQAAERPAPDPFYTYYLPPSGYGDAGAGLYPCPRPTPPRVGHTYITYQPLNPHEFLYVHREKYRTYHPGSGWTRTKVWWGHDLLSQGSGELGRWKLWPFQLPVYGPRRLIPQAIH